MAAKINKFRKVVKKAGEFVAPTKGFDPEEYARKLTKMEDPVGDKAFVEREEMEEYVGKKVLRGGYDDDDDDRKKVLEESEEEKEDDDAPPKNAKAFPRKVSTTKRKNDRELRTSGKCSKRNRNETAFKRKERKGRKNSKRRKKYETRGEKSEGS